MPLSRRMETVQQHCAIGMRFWDSAFGLQARGGETDGLEIDLYPRAQPGVRRRLEVNRSGTYVCHAVPGLRRWELSDLPPEELWATALRPYRIEVHDPRRRFIDMAFDADLPWRGLLDGLAPWTSPPGVPAATALLPLLQLPLFSAPSRALPDPLAAVYAQLRLSGSGELAAGALLAVQIDGRLRAIGLADELGRVAVLFPYPEPPRRQLLSPPEARSDFSWPLTLEAYFAAPSSASPSTAQPRRESRPFIDLASALRQLSQPRVVIGSLSSPDAELRLHYRATLTARTRGAAAQDASFLLIA